VVFGADEVHAKEDSGQLRLVHSVFVFGTEGQVERTGGGLPSLVRMAAAPTMPFRADPSVWALSSFSLRVVEARWWIVNVPRIRRFPGSSIEVQPNIYMLLLLPRLRICRHMPRRT